MLALWWKGFILMALLIPLHGATAETQCSRAININEYSKNSVAYGPRGSYCEGLYRLPHGMYDEVSILGYHLLPLKFPSIDVSTVSIHVARPEGASSTLEISDRLDNKSYQLDYVFPPGEHVLNWDLKLVRDSRVNLDIEDLALLACMLTCEDSSPVLVPVGLDSRDWDSLTYEIIIGLPITAKTIHISITDQGTAVKVFSKVFPAPPVKTLPIILNEMRKVERGDLSIEVVLKDGSTVFRQVTLLGNADP